MYSGTSELKKTVKEVNPLKQGLKLDNMLNWIFQYRVKEVNPLKQRKKYLTTIYSCDFFLKKLKDVV